MARLSFPSFDEWCSVVLHPEDTHPWNFRTREFYDEYRGKYAVSKMVKPASILEVGVRFGYGAWSFLCGSPDARYTGLDMDEPSWGPYQGVPRLWAAERLRKDYPYARIQTIKVNTQIQEQPKLQRYDFVHIDADHSYEGALRDIITFWRKCDRVMVVDDYGQIPEVRHAVQEFVRTTSNVVLLDTPSLRGSAILVRD